MLTVYKEATSESYLLQRPKQNIFDHALLFVEYVNKLKRIILDYGFAFLKLYDQAKDLEFYRLKAIKEALRCFIKQLEQFFGKQTIWNFDSASKTLFGVEEKAICEKSFDLLLLVKDTDAQKILSETNSSLLTTYTIKAYIDQLRNNQLANEFANWFLLRTY